MSFLSCLRTNWEYENLVSMIVTKHPIERFLSGGRCGEFHNGHEKGLRGDPTNETQALFWEYANAECADNYALRVLVEDKHCVDGAKTSLECMESAKILLRRFTFVLDSACLNDGMIAVGKQLHLNITEEAFSSRKHHSHPLSLRERLGNDTLYDYLNHKFRRDIELYEYSKGLSIVQCDQNISPGDV